MKFFKKYKYLILLIFALHFFFLAGFVGGNSLFYLALGAFFLTLSVRSYLHRCNH